jgi:hypothetical protein
MSRTARTFLFLLAAVLAGGARVASGAQIQFNLNQFSEGQLPPGLAGLVTGEGKPGDWKIIDEIVAPTLKPLLPGSFGSTAKHSVLAQTSRDAVSNHFPLLLYTNETLMNFTATTRLKIVSGSVAPEAGVAFRVQDQNNYYVVRASAEGNLLWYRVVGGVRYEGQGIGVRTPVPLDTWEELRVECAGNQIRCYWNGKLTIPPPQAGAPTNEVAINDTTFAAGKFGFWTAADTVACFADTRIDYTTRVPFIQTVVSAVMKKNPRLLGLKVYEFRNSPTPVLVADGREEGIGSPGGKAEEDVIHNGTIMYLPQKDSVELTLPLRDRNGDIIAALKTTMTTFRGETTDTSVTRATTVKKAVEEQLNTLQDIND